MGKVLLGGIMQWRKGLWRYGNNNTGCSKDNHDRVKKRQMLENDS